VSDTPSVDLSIIIVSWNVVDLLRACLNSISNDHALKLSNSDSGYIRTEIIVVDSLSQDTTTTMVASEFPYVKLIAQSENVGFTKGNNIGFEQAVGRFLMLLNPDTEIIGDALSRMVDYIEKHQNVGIIGPHTLNTDGTTQSSRRRFPTIATGFFESTWLQNWGPESILDRFYVADKPDDGVYDVDWVQGSALLARRQLYQDIGGLDTEFVMYSEELDWCKRAKDAGWRVVYFGEAHIFHHGGKSSEQSGARKHILFQQSKLRYFFKYHGNFVATVLRIFLLSSYLCQILIESAKSALGSKRQMRNERIRTYWQVVRSGLRVS